MAVGGARRRSRRLGDRSLPELRRRMREPAGQRDDRDKQRLAHDQYPPDPSSPEGPTMNERPSEVVISRATPAFCVMSRACDPFTVTLSPGFSVPGLKPLRIRDDGVLASNFHVSTLPEASVTSTTNCECGLTRRISVTTPVTTTGLVASKAAAKE